VRPEGDAAQCKALLSIQVAAVAQHRFAVTVVVASTHPAPSQRETGYVDKLARLEHGRDLPTPFCPLSASCTVSLKYIPGTTAAAISPPGRGLGNGVCAVVMGIGPNTVQPPSESAPAASAA
jgi:hypothetical protein